MSLLAPVPSVVEERSSDALEWGRLRELVAGFAQSRVGAEWLLGLNPSLDAAWIARQHDLVGEMRRLIAEGAMPALGGLFDPIPLLDRARIVGVSLDPEELRDLLLLVDSIARWQAFIARPPEALAGKLDALTALGGPSSGERLAALAGSD